MLIRFIFIAILLLLPAQSWAARLFTTGFEEPFAAADLLTTMWTSKVGSPVVDVTHVHSGAQALHLNPTSASWSVTKNMTTLYSTEGMALYTRIYLFPTTIPGSTTDLLRTRSNGGTNQWILQILSTGKLHLINSANGSTTFDAPTAFTTGKFYRIEIRHKLSTLAGGATGQIEVRTFSVSGTTETAVDDFGDGNFTGGDGDDNTTLSAAGNVRDWFVGQVGSSATSDFWFDDVAVNDDSGSLQASWPGPGKIALIKAASDFSATWTKGGSAPAGNNYLSVNDVPGASPDDGTTLNCDTSSCTAAATTNEDQLGNPMTAFPAEVTSDAVMAIIDVYARVNVATAISGTMALVIWDNVLTRTQGPTITVNSTTWRILTTAEHQVLSLGGKTKANLNAYYIGYKSLSGTVAKQVTALWANVEWLEAPATGGTHKRMRLGIGL